MLEALKTRLETYKGQWPALSAESGVPVSTLRKVAQGAVKNPRIATVDKLSRALDRWSLAEGGAQ